MPNGQPLGVEQWGINIGGAVQTSTLPITFTNVFLAVASTSTEWCCPGCSATNTTVTTRAYQSNRPDVAQPNDVNWIVIGCQPQWGYSGYAVNFPISFDIVYNVLSIPQNTASTSNSYWGRFYITNLTKNGFTVSDTGAGSNRWLAIGKAQPQWGKPTVRGNNIFPIPFPNSALAITSAGIGGWHTVDVSIVNNNSYSVLGWATDSPSSARISLPNVIAIGF